MCIIAYWGNSHWAQLANHVSQELGLVMLMVTHSVPTVCTTSRQKNSLTKDVTFLHKSYGE